MASPFIHVLFGDDNDTCDNNAVYNLTSNLARCKYVHDHIDTCVGESLINYYELFYCDFKENYYISVAFTVFLYQTICCIRLF